MKFLIRKVLALGTTYPDKFNQVFQKGEYTLEETESKKQVRVIWPFDKDLKIGQELDVKRTAALMVAFHEFLGPGINGLPPKPLTVDALDGFEKMAEPVEPIPLFVITCVSGHPCEYLTDLGESNFFSFRIDAESARDAFDHPEWPLDLKARREKDPALAKAMESDPKPPACGPHRVIPYFPFLEEEAHAEAERTKGDEEPPGQEHPVGQST